MEILQLLFGLVVLAVTLIIPGYCLTLGFFPRKNELEELERFAFSFVFSITFLPLLVLIENQVFGVKIDFVSSFGSVLLLVVAGLAIWKFRTRNMKKEEVVQFWIPKTKNLF